MWSLFMESLINLDQIVEGSNKTAEDDIRDQLGDKVSNVRLIDDYHKEYEIAYADTPKALMRKLVEINYFDEDDANDFINDVIVL